MPTSRATHRTYSFSEFTLDLDRGALLRAGADIKLRPKSFEMLRYLVERQGLLVTKDELLDAIWGRKVVTEDAITQCMRDIRIALSDQSQKKLLTIPRRGYIFDLPVTASDTPSRTRFASSWPRWRLAAALVLVLGVAAIWWGFGNRGVYGPLTVEPRSAIAPHSIVVLPFLDMSPGQDHGYFADGISVEVLNLLAQVPGLRVIARTSAFSFKGQNVDIATIAERLNVTHVLEGSVRKSSNTVRITAQLVNASTSEHIWSETFDRTLEDIFDIQDEIAAEVVEQLKFTLLAPVPKSRNTDPETYRLYLLATHILNQLDWGKNAQAESLLRQALQMDPNFAPAWRELGRVLWRQIGKGHSLQEDIRRSRDALDRALAIEPDDAASLAYSAWHTMEFDGDIVRAARLFERAFSIEPANENVVRATLSFAMAFGRPEDAVALGEYAIAHNPLCFSCNRNLARAYQNAGRLDEAEAAIRTVQSLFGRGDVNLGLTLLLKGQPQAALEAFGEEQSEPRRLAGVAMAMHDLGRPEDSVVAFTALLEASAYETTWNVAKVHAWMGQIDAAFEAIDKAAERDQLRAEGDIVRWKLLGTPTQSRNLVFRQLHNDPRWQEFLEKYGISAEQLADVQFKVTLPK
jgi:TolB-like protein/DNA-binding winged helix-turn-helix (wHTH) protein/Flp pilus assembly protein TadD